MAKAQKGRSKMSLVDVFDFEKAVKDYLLYKKTAGKGVTDLTVKAHEYAIKYFFVFYKGSIHDEQQLRNGVFSFLDDKSNGYYNKQLQGLRGFFKYLVGEGFIKEDPTEGLSFRKHEERIVDHSLEEIRKIMNTPDRKTFSGYRDYAFMLLQFDTGIRPSEAMQLLITDFKSKEGLIYIRPEVSKTREGRFLPLSYQTVQVIEKLIRYRHEVWDNTVPIFCTFNGNPLDTHSLQQNFKSYSKKAEVHFSPYHLRHCFALNYLRNNGDVLSLAKIMGHQKLETTRIYVNWTKTDIITKHEMHSPLASLFASYNKETNNIVQPKQKQQVRKLK